jgi:hypothetical protein
MRRRTRANTYSAFASWVLVEPSGPPATPVRRDMVAALVVELPERIEDRDCRDPTVARATALTRF